MNQLSLLKEEIKSFPNNPGVYLMRSSLGEILYVGKASRLRSRVLSYFSKEQDARYHVRFLMRRVHSIEFIVTDTPKEALLLENTLIKKHRPRYNIDLKDDKSYVSLKLNLRHVAPRLLMTRRLKKDGSQYYGPYDSAQACRELVELAERYFGLRTCSDHEYANRSRPCLKYQIHRCTAPCVGKISLADYGMRVEQLKAFLEGRSDQVQTWAKEQMYLASQRENFEEAARFRDLLQQVQKTLERQKVAKPFGASQDVIALMREGRQALIFVLPYEEGHLQEGKSFFLESFEEDGELLGNFLLQYYEEASKIPRELLLPWAWEGMDLVEQFIRERASHAFQLKIPQRGEKKERLDLAYHNAKLYWARQQHQEASRLKALEEIQNKLGLSEIPHRIECYDISHFQGSETFGSMVTFIQGQPYKSYYRRFKLESLKGPDDFASLYEVLCRRLRRAKEEADLESPWALPQLMVIDGGKGQLKAALAALKDENVTGIALVALAKSRSQSAGTPGALPTRSEERFFLPARKNPVTFRVQSGALKLLTHLRDEAHRFGISAQRGAQRKKSLASALEEVPGLGIKRRTKLLQTYGSYEKIKQARPEDLASLLKVSLKQSEEILSRLS